MRIWHNAKTENNEKANSEYVVSLPVREKKFPKNKFSENSPYCVWKWVQFDEFSEYSDNLRKMSKLSDNLQDAR